MELTGFLPFWGKCMQETSTDTEESLVNFWKKQSMHYPRSPWHLSSTMSLAAYNTEITCLLWFFYPLCIWPFSPSSPKHSTLMLRWPKYDHRTCPALKAFLEKWISGRMRKSRSPAIWFFTLALLVQIDQKISINWISGYKANLLLSLYLSFRELQENRQVICVT